MRQQETGRPKERNCRDHERERGRMGKSEKDGGAEVTVVGGFISVRILVGLPSQRERWRGYSTRIAPAQLVCLGVTIRHRADRQTGRGKVIQDDERRDFPQPHITCCCTLFKKRWTWKVWAAPALRLFLQNWGS